MTTDRDPSGIGPPSASSTDAAEPRMARLPLVIGGGLVCATGVVGPLVLDLAVVDAWLVGALLIGVPALAFAQRRILSTVEIERIPLYWGSIVTLWLLGASAWLVGARTGHDAVGLTPLASGRFLAWSLGLTAMGLAVIWLFRALAVALGRPDPPLLGHLLPETRAERRVFVVLSLSAGTCEELAYRGYLVGVLMPAIGVAAAVVLTSVGFGLVHVYQGGLGMARAGAVGAALALGLLLSGSLWPVVVAHAAIDLIVGLVVGERMLSHAPPNGVDPAVRAR